MSDADRLLVLFALGGGQIICIAVILICDFINRQKAEGDDDV